MSAALAIAFVLLFVLNAALTVALLFALRRATTEIVLAIYGANDQRPHWITNALFDITETLRAR